MMDFYRGYLERIAEEIEFPQLKLSEIPAIDLYMEQLLSFIESKFAGFRRTEYDKIFTSTMINNYTKQGLLMPPENKKYTRDHLILLTLIYNLKNVLSIGDIKLLFGPVLNNIATRDDDIMSLKDIYSAFLDLNTIEFESLYNSFINKMNMIEEKTLGLDKDDKNIAQLFLLVIMLVAHANAQKRLAEKIIDEFFAQV